LPEFEEVMSDNISTVWGKFFDHRTRTLWERFPGHYRSLVVETNDPLNMMRVRFKCPDLHDFDLKPFDCPWAVSCFDLGGKRAGRFVAPVIGDWIWITFERQHPYGPIWTGFADPTRRKFYTYPQVFQITPLALDIDGKKTEKPKDYDEAYLPKDGRPMGHGWQDRYGNLEVHSAIGFYPVEHQEPPPPPDHDAVSGSNFEQKARSPKVNDPDRKYMARVTKYGNISLMSDQGYHWKKQPCPADNILLGEFEGDAIKDEEYETRRWLFVQRLLNDGVPKADAKDGDQRKQIMLTRYGSRIEMRDTGWAQKGPIESKTRFGEFGVIDPRVISKEKDNDYRWIKIRSKGGMLFQIYDKGVDPAKDKFVRRGLLEESGSKSEMEDKYWGDRDARWMRMVTRYGLKFTLDDRGSSDVDARNKELPRGIGWLFKGRRSPAAKKREAVGNSRGFQMESNERDDANHTSWCTPLGQSIEMNDRYQYMMLTAALGKGWVPKWLHVKDNEFIRKPTMLGDPEQRTHHLKIDHDNEYIRFKTRAGKGVKPERPVNLTGVGSGEINQGIEARDGRKGDGPWTEIVDCQHRGMWFSKKEGLGIWRARKKKKMFQWFDEKSRKIVIYNDEANGTIEIYSDQNVNVITNGSINLRADKHVFIRAGRSIRMQAAGTKFTMINGNIQTNAIFRGPEIKAKMVDTPDPGGEVVERIVRPTLPFKREPTDRAKTYNKPFEEAKPII